MNGVTSTLGCVLAKKYPSIMASLRELFSPSLAPVAIVIRSTGNKEKYITTKIGQSKFVLYHVGGIWDFLAGKVLNIAYPVWPKTVQDILVMARVPRLGQVAGLLSGVNHTDKANDQTSIFSTHSTILTIPKVVAGHMIVEHIHTEPIDRVHGEGSSLDPTTYLPQRDRSNMLVVLMSEERRQHKSKLDKPEARITAPKTVADKIGRIKTVTNFVSLIVNVVNQSAACADFDAMKANGSPHLFAWVVNDFYSYNQW